MTGYNLPPGCNVSDIPGNRPEDAAFEKFLDEVSYCINALGREGGDDFTQEQVDWLGEQMDAEISAQTTAEAFIEKWPA